MAGIKQYSCARKFGHPYEAAALLAISPDVYNIASCQLLLRYKGVSSYFSDKDTECISICRHFINKKAQILMCISLGTL